MPTTQQLTTRMICPVSHLAFYSPRPSSALPNFSPSFGELELVLRRTHPAVPHSHPLLLPPHNAAMYKSSFTKSMSACQ